MATLFSTHPSVSLLGRDRRYGGLVPQLLYLTVMLLVIGAYRQEHRSLRAVAVASAISATIAGVYALVQAAGLDPVLWIVNGQQPEFPIATLGNSNFAGGYIAVALPLSISVVALARVGLPRALAGMAVGVQLLALWFTHTRGGLLAILVALASAVLLLGRGIPRWLRRSVILLAGTVLAATVFVLWHPGFDSAPGPAALVRSSTLLNRVDYWRSAAHMIADRPMLGTGPDTFYAHYGGYQNAQQALNEPSVIVDKPHNILIERVTDTGIIGGSSYLILIGAALAYGHRRLRERPPERLLLLGFVASLIGYLTQGFFSIDAPPLAFMGWLALGGIAALADPSVTSSEAEPPATTYRTRSPWTSRLVRLTAVVGTVGLVGMGIRPLRANIASRDGDLARAMALQPLEASYPAQAADRERSLATQTRNRNEQTRHLTAANAYLLRAIRLQPGNSSYLSDLAAVNSYWAHALDPGRFTIADRWWRQALEQRPNDPVLRDRYVSVRAAIRRSVVALERSAAESAEPDAWLEVAEGFKALGEKDRAAAASEQARQLALEAQSHGETVATPRP